MLEKINQSYLNFFEDRLFPCNITRDNYSKKQVKLPPGWNDNTKEFEDFNEPNANSAAIRTGNGLVVIDVDTKGRSLLEPNMKELVNKWLSDSATFTVETTHGYHFYFESDKHYSNSVRVSDYVDIRGDGGCVFCYTKDSSSSYEVICENEPLPMTDELEKYLKLKKPTQTSYTINEENLRITEEAHNLNQSLSDAIKSNDLIGVIESAGFELDDFMDNKDGLYMRINRLAFILAMNPACPNEIVRAIVEQITKEICGYDVQSDISIQKLNQIFSNMIYCSEDAKKDSQVDDIFAEMYVSPEDLEKMMVDSHPILGDFILKGQLSSIYGPSGSGKSLLLMYLLKSSNEQIYYLNADDNINEGALKAKIAHIYGHMMIVSGSKNENDPSKIVAMIEKKLSIDSDYFRDKIIILDTIKKFVDVLSKKDAKHFLQLMRKITLSGGTVVFIGHTNKHRSKSNELIFEGVGDFKSDMDCIYELDTITDDKKNERTILLTNKKSRGSVPSTVTYTYNCSEEIKTFEERMSTVKHLSKEEQKKKEKELIQIRLLSQYNSLYPLIFKYLSDNPHSSQSSIIKFIKEHDDCSDSEKTIRRCLSELSGIKWTFEHNKNNNNTKEFIIKTESPRYVKRALNINKDKV